MSRKMSYVLVSWMVACPGMGRAMRDRAPFPKPAPIQKAKKSPKMVSLKELV